MHALVSHQTTQTTPRRSKAHRPGCADGSPPYESVGADELPPLRPAAPVHPRTDATHLRRMPPVPRERGDAAGGRAIGACVPPRLQPGETARAGATARENRKVRARHPRHRTQSLFDVIRKFLSEYDSAAFLARRPWRGVPSHHHAGRKERWRTTWAPGTSRPRIDSLQMATPAGFAPVQNAVPTGDDGSRASRTLMVPTTSRHNHAP